MVGTASTAHPPHDSLNVCRTCVAPACVTSSSRGGSAAVPTPQPLDGEHRHRTVRGHRVSQVGCADSCKVPSRHRLHPHRRSMTKQQLQVRRAGHEAPCQRLDAHRGVLAASNRRGHGLAGGMCSVPALDAEGSTVARHGGTEAKPRAVACEQPRHSPCRRAFTGTPCSPHSRQPSSRHALNGDGSSAVACEMAHKAASYVATPQALHASCGVAMPSTHRAPTAANHPPPHPLHVRGRTLAPCFAGGDATVSVMAEGGCDSTRSSLAVHVGSPPTTKASTEHPLQVNGTPVLGESVSGNTAAGESQVEAEHSHIATQSHNHIFIRSHSQSHRPQPHEERTEWRRHATMPELWWLLAVGVVGAALIEPRVAALRTG